MTSNPLHQTNQGSGTMTHDDPSKRRALRDLNREYGPKREALMGVLNAANHALRLEEADYNRKRSQIINAQDQDDWAMRA